MISLLHVSDVHFGPKHLPELSEAVVALAASAKPSAVAISGDLTQRAKRPQFRAARAFVDRFACPVAFVPGNHDVPMYRVWERLFAPFGAWRGAFARELVREAVTDEIALFGLNSAHAWTTKHGRVERRDLAQLAARLDEAPADALRVLIAHHPLAAAPELGDEPVARRGSEALDLARRARVELVLSGHLHHGFWLRAGERGPIVVQCGTTCSSRGRGSEKGRSSLVWIEADAREIRLERRLWEPGVRRFVASAEARFARTLV